VHGFQILLAVGDRTKAVAEIAQGDALPLLLNAPEMPAISKAKLLVRARELMIAEAAEVDDRPKDADARDKEANREF
jgi:hypothetical protein